MTRALDHYTDQAMLAAMSTQPQIEATLLFAGYMADNLKLDLYGYFAGEYFVEDVALAGTTVSLYALLSASTLRDLSAWCERNLDDAAAQAENARCDAGIARQHLTAEVWA